MLTKNGFPVGWRQEWKIRARTAPESDAKRFGAKSLGRHQGGPLLRKAQETKRSRLEERVKEKALARSRQLRIDQLAQMCG